MKKILFILLSVFIYSISIGQDITLLPRAGATSGTAAEHYGHVFNVLDYGAIPDSSTDCTTSIQAAINAAEAAGGGVIYFPSYYLKGVYLVKGALSGWYNSQLHMGKGNRSGNAIQITFLGEKEPSYELSILGAGWVINGNRGPIIQSTIVGSGTNPSVLSADTVSFAGTGWCTEEVTLKNLTIRTNTTSSINADTAGSMSAINFADVVGCNLENLRIDITSQPINSVQPATTTVGMSMPKNGNSAWTKVEKVLIFGYYTGIIVTEHTDIDYISLMACFDGVKAGAMNHDWYAKRILINGCVNGIHFTAANNFKIENYDAEHFTTATFTRWYNFANDLLGDNNQYGVGTINYFTVTSNGAAPINTWVTNTVSNLFVGWKPMGQSPTRHLFNIGDTINNSIYGTIYASHPVGLEIMANAADDNPTIMMSRNVAGGGGVHSQQYWINTFNNKILRRIQDLTYTDNLSIQTKEFYGTPSTGAFVNVSTTDAFQFALGVPLRPMLWTAATRPTTGALTGMLGINSDSLISAGHPLECLVAGGPIWRQFAFTSDLTLDNILKLGPTLTANRTIANAGFNFDITGTGNIGLGVAATTTGKVTTGIVNYNSTYGTGLVTSNGTSNDAITGASGTVATMAANRVQIPTYTATNTAVTYTNSYNWLIDGPVTSSTHVTQTNPWAFGVAAGNSQFAGHVETTGSSPAFHAGSAGTNVTSVTPSGTDGAMHVIIVTSGAVTGAIGSIDYNSAWTAAPHVVISCTSNSTGNAAVPIIAKATSSTLLVLSGVFAGAGTFEYDVISLK